MPVILIVKIKQQKLKEIKVYVGRRGERRLKKKRKKKRRVEAIEEVQLVGNDR